MSERQNHPLPDIFSRRERLARGDVPDVYQYGDIPNPLRVQVVHIVKHALEKWDRQSGWRSPEEFWEPVRAFFRKERGVFSLINPTTLNAENEVVNYMMNETDTSKCLDVIEVFCRALSSSMTSRGFKN